MLATICISSDAYVVVDMYDDGDDDESCHQDPNYSILSDLHVEM